MITKLHNMWDKVKDKKHNIPKTKNIGGGLNLQHHVTQEELYAGRHNDPRKLNLTPKEYKNLTKGAG